MQDAIVVTSSGAETLPFLASFQLPASLAFFVIYGRIIDLHLPRSMTFALVVAPLLAAYAGFALFLYPAADLLHPHGFTTSLAPMLPVGLHGLLKVIAAQRTSSMPLCAGARDMNASISPHMAFQLSSHRRHECNSAA